MIDMLHKVVRQYTGLMRTDQLWLKKWPPEGAPPYGFEVLITTKWAEELLGFAPGLFYADLDLWNEGTLIEWNSRKEMGYLFKLALSPI